MPSAKNPKVAIVDYGMGNLFSVKHSCEYAGLQASITSSRQEILDADAVIVPGVGAFGDAMETLQELDLVSALQEVAASSKPLVGICLGMQLLMTESFEFGRHAGLGVFPGVVVRLENPLAPNGVLKVPHVCWNRMFRTETANDPWAGSLLDGLPNGVFMYFVHSFYVKPEVQEVVIATTKYGNIEFCSALQYRNIFACQCHPERSGLQGLKVYRNLASMLNKIKSPRRSYYMVSPKILDRQLPILPKEIKFCRKCVVSNQRPRIHFNENGVCGACTYAETKKNQINWQERERMLRELCDQYRRNDGRFDVIVPCSGGKDSGRVAHELKHKYGMHPLTVTWAPFEYTPEGYVNFRNFIKIGGFNNLMAWQNGRVHRKLSRIAFEALGDAWQPFTYGQMCYAFHIAKNFGVKLVFFGENGEAEYSGDPRVFNLRGMPFEIWAEQYFKGITVDDLIQYGLEETDYFTKDDFDESDLMFYRPPDIEEMKTQGIEFHWFSFYRRWIPQENYYYASEHTGFQANPEGRSEGTYSKYASLDDQTDGFHFYLSFIKFGIARATSDAAHEVRDDHITREEAVALVKRFDGEFPKRWYREFLEYLDITDEQFWNVMDKFRQPHIWKKENGVWKLRKAIYDEEGKSDEIPVYISSLPESAKNSWV